MEFSTREDIEAPLGQVFADATNFAHIERQAMRRGVNVRRKTRETVPVAGMEWTAAYRFRGKPRDAEITLTDCDAPNAMTYVTVTGGLEAVTHLDFVALSRSRTRVGMRVELKPQTLSARLMVQSLKLAKANIEKRFRVKMAEYAKDMEERLKRGA